MVILFFREDNFSKTLDFKKESRLRLNGGGFLIILFFCKSIKTNSDTDYDFICLRC